MSIEIKFSTDSITQTERRALIAFLEATGQTVADASFPLVERTMPMSEIKVGMTVTEAGRHIATSADREIEQLSKDVADTQSPAAPSAPAPAAPAAPTDLASIFGGAPTEPGKTQWPFPTEPEQPASPAVALDKNNLPWDARIHASSKAINADGSWRAKKMIDAAVVATVEAELRATMGAPAPVATHGSPELDADAIKLEALAGAGSAGPTMGAPCPGPDPSLAHMRTVAISAPLPASPSATPAQPAAPVAPAAPSGNPDTDLPVFLKEATALINAGRATTADMIAAANSAGIPHPGALTQRPDLIATVRAAFMAKVTPVAVAV